MKTARTCLFVLACSLVGTDLRAQVTSATLQCAISTVGNRYQLNAPALLPAAEGDVAAFSASSNGSQPTYRWFKDGIVVPGVTGRNWSVQDLTSLDSGDYQVVVTSGGSSVTSGVISLTIWSKPLQSPPDPIEINHPVTFSVVPFLVPAGTSFQWFHNGHAITNATNLTLLLPSVGFTDSGEYRFDVRYSTLPGVVKCRPSRLRVYSSITAPIIVTQPLPQIAVNGGSAVFTVGASGTPMFSYQWQHNELTIPNATNFYLRLPAVSESSTGDFRAVVSNLAGSITSSPARLTLVARKSPDPTAQSLVTSGRAALGQHTNSSLSAASATFAAAIGLDPMNDLANFFYGITRIVDVANQAPANTLLDRFRFTAAGRSVYGWTSQPVKDGQGHYIAPPGTSSSDPVTFLRAHAFPEIINGLTNLAVPATADFSVSLSREELVLGSVTLDQGDLWLIRSLLHASLYGIRSGKSLELSSQLTDIENLATNSTLTLERVLADHPNLLTFADPSEIAPARASLEAAIDAYIQGVGLIRSRSPDPVRLFSLEDSDFQDEERLRQVLLDLKASLNQSIVLNEEPQVMLNLGRLATGAVSPRSVLPEFDGNDPGVLPDPELGGAIRSMGPPLILQQPSSTVFRSNEPIRLSVTAVGAAPLSYQWQKDGVLIIGATNRDYSVHRPTVGDCGSYRVAVSNHVGSVRSSTARVDPGGGVVMAFGAVAEITNVPPGLDDVVQVSVGWQHVLVLRSSGRIASWGTGGMTNVPSDISGIREVQAGFNRSFALRSDGTVLAWGSDGIPTQVAEGVVQMSSSGSGVAAISGDGEINVGPGAFRIATGLADIISVTVDQMNRVFAIREDGRVAAWDRLHQATSDHTEVDNVRFITCNPFASVEWLCAIRTDGTVLVKSDRYDAWQPFATQVVQGSGGVFLRSDGTIVLWPGVSNQTTLRATEGLVSGVSAVASGGYGNTVLLGSVLLFGVSDTVADEGGVATFEVSPYGKAPFDYQWLFNGNPIPGATLRMLTITNTQPSAAGNYSVRVGSKIGSVTSRTAKLEVNAAADRFATPRRLVPGGGRFLTSNARATREPGEPLHAGNFGGRSLWFEWTPLVSGPVQVDTIGTGFDTLLAVYTGSSLSELSLVVTDDDGAGVGFASLVNFITMAGTTYRIAVDGYNDASGNVVLNVTPAFRLGTTSPQPIGGFGFDAIGQAGRSFVLEMSTDLRKWSPFLTNQMPEAGTLQLSDPGAAGRQQRFFRAVAE